MLVSVQLVHLSLEGIEQFYYETTFSEVSETEVLRYANSRQEFVLDYSKTLRQYYLRKNKAYSSCHVKKRDNRYRLSDFLYIFFTSVFENK